MKKLLLTIGLLSLFGAKEVFAAERMPSYGDLYDVQWCPCDQEEKYGPDGATVLGKTVLCPCDSLYSGYDKGFKEDVKDFNKAVKKKLQVVNYFKYYVGFDYTSASFSGGKDTLSFDDIILSHAIEMKPDSILEDNDALSFVLGARINKWFGLEAFYLSTYEDNQKYELDRTSLGDPAAADGKYLMNEYITSYSAYGLDLIAYIPLGSYFDIVGSAGIAQYKFKNRAVFSAYEGNSNNFLLAAEKNFNEDKVGLRAAIGAQVNIVDGVVLRAMYRYISIGGDVVDDMNEFSLGMRFLF